MALGILHALQHPKRAVNPAGDAYRVVREEYNWERIAQMTVSVYARIMAEAALAAW